MQRVELSRERVIKMCKDKHELDILLTQSLQPWNYSNIYTILHRNKKLFKQLDITEGHGWWLFNHIDSYWNNLNNHSKAAGITFLATGAEDYRRN